MDDSAPKPPTRQVILDRLKTIGAEVGQPVSLFEIGTALVPAGYDQHELMNALFALHDEKIIDLIDGNRLQLRSVDNGSEPTARRRKN